MNEPSELYISRETDNVHRGENAADVVDDDENVVE